MKNITQEHVNRKCNNTQETLHMILNERKNGMYPNKISGDDPQTNAKVNERSKERQDETNYYNVHTVFTREVFTPKTYMIQSENIICKSYNEDFQDTCSNNSAYYSKTKGTKKHSWGNKSVESSLNKYVTKFINKKLLMNTTGHFFHNCSAVKDGECDQFQTSKKSMFKIMKNSSQLTQELIKKINNLDKKRSEGKSQELKDLDYCIHCKQFVGGESISNITRHSVLCKNRNIKYLTCFKCNFTTRNIRQYERHCFHSHYSSTFTCPKCQHISNNIFTFVLHRRKHLNSRPYPCHLCGKHFVTVHTLLRHLGIAFYYYYLNLSLCS